jgi:hypothetical protein
VGASDQKWYKKVFKNYEPKAPYCTALQSNPQDLSICEKRNERPKTDPAWTAMVREAETGPRGLMKFHMMKYPEDKWRHEAWRPNQKRGEVNDKGDKGERDESVH